MSSKSSTKKETEQDKERRRKLPPMEEIVTRHKSALLKRQLRNKEASMKKIIEMTQMLKGPLSTCQRTTPKSPNKAQRDSQRTVVKGSPQKGKKAPVKKEISTSKKQPSPVKGKKFKPPKKIKQKDLYKPVNEVASTEFYPNKLKRNIVIKKIILKPKSELKLVGSKRKMAVPHRGVTSSPKRWKVDEASMQELIMEADEDLSDEDLLEILTCPSPVWWEEPPPEYFYKLTPPPSPIDIQNAEASLNITEPDGTETVTEILMEAQQKVVENKNKDEKFMKKRSVLENLLGNIRNKNNNLVNNVSSINDSDVNLNSEVQTEEDGKVCVDKEQKKDIKGTKNNRSPERVSESTEDDELSALRDEKFLDDLENIKIPIKTEECDVKDFEGIHNNHVDSYQQTIAIKKEPFTKDNIQEGLNKKYTQIKVKSVTDLNKSNMFDLIDREATTNVFDTRNSLSHNYFDVSKSFISSMDHVKEERENHELSKNSICSENVLDTNNILNEHTGLVIQASADIKKDQDNNTKTKSVARNFGAKRISPRKNKVISFKPHGLPVKNAELLKEKTETRKKVRKIDKKIEEMTEKIKASGIKIQKSKPDIMTVYKIICQDKFPLGKGAQNETNGDLSGDKNKINESELNKSVDSFKNRIDLFYKTYKNTHRRNKSLDVVGHSSKESLASTSSGQESSNDIKVER